MLETTQSAFVLHSRPYRENQLLIDLLTEHDGKLAALSYVGHSTKSSRKALLQPFLPIKVTLKGQYNLKSLIRVEPIGKSFLLKKNALFSAFYINELLVRLLGDNIACEALFQQYKMSLEALAQASNIEICLREFELMLMDELGLSFDFSLVFEHSAEGFYYLPDEGFIPAYTKLKQPCYNRWHLQAIAERDLSTPEVLNTFKALMRQVINHLLDGVPLNSRKLFSKKA
ncbi:DNA repair protein RecO [Colwellia sp. MB02u-18]|uniref:DNA repair protein RecO n=1 Tax=unclassified Colwellia TaxID=196834 RepID=UPI0015F5BF13|nr:MULTISPECIES: DNA repair protein RecO [unclassified Colwellia]MBA6223110.1 DNA repair protein RecO [Colwellia sp. MB3u-45]MBA6267534.1 DNA repair protein RecO [Colwellia sp. MB3u-43]MBA6320339.1 DNA repair protein RecO [Colwellia sp. MB02u-19]MBA6323098.1 DNA repair protein RecO [Colwellia sp. MB02u-18]MBA6330431.1 DNA repair protein RecO [Colwellia sp. MB02u-12]